MNTTSHWASTMSVTMHGSNTVCRDATDVSKLWCQERGRGGSWMVGWWRYENRGRKDMLHSHRPLERQQTLAGTKHTAHMDLPYMGTDKHADQHAGSTQDYRKTHIGRLTQAKVETWASDLKSIIIGNHIKVMFCQKYRNSGLHHQLH